MLVDENLIAQVEVMLYASTRSITTATMARRLGVSVEHMQTLIERFASSLASSMRGLQIRETSAGWRLETKPEYAPLLASIRAEREERDLSIQALETLAVITLRQPVTLDEITKTRGLDSAGTIETLRKRKLIARSTKKPNSRATQWVTTPGFLEMFGLSSIEDLFEDGRLGKIFGPILDVREGTADAGETQHIPTGTPIAG